MLSDVQLRDVLGEVQSGLQEIFGDRLHDTVLFGSYARGDQDEESDVDIMAIVDMNSEDLSHYRRRVSHFSSNFDLQYDVLFSITLQDLATFQQYSSALPFFQNVIREGVSFVQQ